MGAPHRPLSPSESASLRRSALSRHGRGRLYNYTAAYTTVCCHFSALLLTGSLTLQSVAFLLCKLGTNICSSGTLRPLSKSGFLNSADLLGAVDRTLWRLRLDQVSSLRIL